MKKRWEVRNKKGCWPSFPQSTHSLPRAARRTRGGCGGAAADAVAVASRQGPSLLQWDDLSVIIRGLYRWCTMGAQVELSNHSLKLSLLHTPMCSSRAKKVHIHDTPHVWRVVCGVCSR